MRAPPALDQFPPVPGIVSAPPAPRALAAEAHRIHAESVRYWTAFDTESFFKRPAPDVWAPADQVRHLTKSIRAVTRGLRVPRLLLLARFGWHRGASRSLESLTADYHRALDAGGRAGSFAPVTLDTSELNADGRARI